MAWPYDPKELAKRGALARAAKLSAQQRTAIASHASFRRWYTPRGTEEQRIASYLRRLAQIATKAWEEGNDDRAIRAIAAMGPFERLRIELEKGELNAGRPGGRALESPLNQETLKRLDAARRARMRAILGVEEPEKQETEGDGGEGGGE